MQSAARAKVLLFLGVMIFGIGQSMLFVVFGPLAREMGLSPIQFGLIFTLSNIGLAIASPFWGRKSDSIGRKPIFLVGLAGTAVGLIVLAFAIQVGLWKLLPIWALVFVLFLARSVYSLTATAVYPSSAGFMADITDRKNRARGMALIGGGNSMGAVFGPAIGALGSIVGFVLFPMYAAAALAIIGLIVAATMLAEPTRHENTSGAPGMKITDPRIRPFMYLWIAFFLVFTTLQFITAFYIQDQFGISDPKDVVWYASLALFFLGVFNVGIQLGLFQIIHVTPRTLLRMCFPSLALALAILAVAQDIWQIFPAYALIGLAFSCANPGINGGASLSVEPWEQGATSGLLAAATTVGVVFGPLLGTSLYEIGHTLPMIVGAVVAIAMAVYGFTVPVPDPKHE